MDPSTINWLAVIVASFLGFVIGGLWYGPIFGKAWMKAANITEEDIKNANMGKLYGTTWFLTLIIAVNFGFFFNDPEITLGTGAIFGFATGFGFMMMAVAINGLFERKGWTYILINGGYWVTLATAMGALIGGWK